jgi:hypothetical protein
MLPKTSLQDKKKIIATQKAPQEHARWHSTSVPETLDFGTSFRFKLIQVKNQGLDWKIKH